MNTNSINCNNQYNYCIEHFSYFYHHAAKNQPIKSSSWEICDKIRLATKMSIHSNHFIQTDRQTGTQDNYCNPWWACTLRIYKARVGLAAIPLKYGWEVMYNVKEGHEKRGSKEREDAVGKWIDNRSLSQSYMNPAWCAIWLFTDNRVREATTLQLLTTDTWSQNIPRSYMVHLYTLYSSESYCRNVSLSYATRCVTESSVLSIKMRAWDWE